MVLHEKLSWLLFTVPKELEDLARGWAKPPPSAAFFLRVPVEYASLHAAVCFSTFTLELWLKHHLAIGSRAIYLCMSPLRRPDLRLIQLAVNWRRLVSDCDYGRAGFARGNR